MKKNHVFSCAELMGKWITWAFLEPMKNSTSGPETFSCIIGKELSDGNWAFKSNKTRSLFLEQTAKRNSFFKQIV
jgi:hypothetical protein